MVILSAHKSLYDHRITQTTQFGMVPEWIQTSLLLFIYDLMVKLTPSITQAIVETEIYSHFVKHKSLPCLQRLPKIQFS